MDGNEKSAEYRGSLFDVDIQSLNPEKDPSGENLYWLQFIDDGPDLNRFNIGSYFVGAQFKFHDSESNTNGVMKVVEQDLTNLKIKVEIQD